MFCLDLKNRDMTDWALNGSSRQAIAKYIEGAYSGLRSNHSALLTHHMKRLKNNDQLVMVKLSYMISRYVLFLLQFFCCYWMGMFYLLGLNLVLKEAWAVRLSPRSKSSPLLLGLGRKSKVEVQPISYLG